MKRNQRHYNILRYLLDAISIILAFVIIMGRHASGIGSDLSVFSVLTFVFICLAVWYFSSIYSRLYAERRSNKFSEEIIFVLYNTLIFCILNSSLLFFLQPSVRLPLREYAEFILLVFILSTIAKYIHRKYVHAILWQGKQYDKILLVGGNASAEYFYETVNKYYYYGYKCIGFVDDQISKLNGCQYFGSISNLHAVLGQQPVDEVVITLPDHEHEQIRSCVEVCGYHKVQVRLLPDAYKYATSAVEVDNIGIMPVLNISRLPLDRVENRLVKRLFDISFSLLFFCTVGIIVFPLIALLIRLTSKGPILFRQERWGLNNDRITCYKFRTMFRESSEVDEKGRYQITTKDDPRITRIGRILRRTNLDELPQFWNVLIGNMSVVGPRPHPTPMNLESMHTVENYMLRHTVPPGITGWAQVNGLRGEVKTQKDMQRRVDFDLYYIHRWTFWLDCQIILQTIVNFVRGDQNAY